MALLTWTNKAVEKRKSVGNERVIFGVLLSFIIFFAEAGLWPVDSSVLKRVLRRGRVTCLGYRKRSSNEIVVMAMLLIRTCAIKVGALTGEQLDNCCQ